MASHKSVTTHRAPKKTVTTARTAVTLATATVGSIALLPGMAHADPKETLNDVKAKVDQLHSEAEAASEAYNQANEQFTALQNKVNQIQGQITLEQAQLGTAQNTLGSLAAAQYKSGGIDSTLQLLISSAPDTFLQQSSVLAEVSGQQASSMKNAQEIERQLKQDKATAAADLAQEQKTRDLMAAQKADIDAKQKAAQELLASLTPVQVVQYNQMNGSATGVDNPAVKNLPVATDPRAAIAVAFAEAQIGKPYVYGASGPSAYDCSGLTMAAWGKAGVEMPHSSRDQYAMFPHPTRAELEPGDLVIYYSDAHHVGMYVGNGMIVQAANPSTPIQYAPIGEMPIYGFARP